MKLKYSFLLFFLLIAAKVFAGHCDPAALCADSKTKLYRTTKTTIADSGELAYDISYVKFNINLNNTSSDVSGDVTTTAKVVASSLDTFSFELNNVLTIDSLKVDGSLASVVTSGAIRKVPLSSSLPMGTTFSVQVFYHGTSPTGSGFFSHGLNHSVLSTGTQIMYSCSDPNWAADWWPCKQSIDDKIDSVDMYVTVPDSTKAGSNGLLKSVTPVGGGYMQYHWSTRYPIDYYLISVAVAPYVDYSYYVHFTGSTDSMLVQNYFYDTATFMPLYKKNFDSTGMMIDYFSTLFGRYPFYKEKYGHCFSDLSGGMEHQTMTTIGVTETPLIAHELGHQWFGDCVTYASWRDIWLSEGFASYFEQLYVEHFWGTAAAYDYRTARYNVVLSYPYGSVYLDDTTNVYRIFDGRLTYYKGAAVVHMLRFMAPNDSVFFSGLKNYIQTYKFGLATTEDLKHIMETAYGRNLDTFFNQWVYGQGYPTYTATWNQSGSTVFVRLHQTPSYPSSITLFATPVEIKLQSASGDTVVKVYNDDTTQLYSFTWSKTMTGMTIDPNNWILNKTGLIGKDPKLNVTNIPSSDVQVYPNPAKENWQVAHLPKDINMKLTDVTGKVLWQGESTGSNMEVPGRNMAPGTYLLFLSGNSINTSVRLVHW